GIKKENVDGESSPSTNGTKSTITPPTPTRLAASSTISEDGEERGDLIKFYNTVFMERLQEFSLKFKRSRQSEAPPLSPLPKLRSHPQIFIRPLKTSANEVVMNSSPHKPLQYNFNRSPANYSGPVFFTISFFFSLLELECINELMREAEKKSTRGKRLLVEEDEGSSSKSRKMDESSCFLLPPPAWSNTEAGLAHLVEEEESITNLKSYSEIDHKCN
ncbi:Retinoblastomalike protein 1like, partial [Caligus rogercresseyi]